MGRHPRPTRNTGQAPVELETGKLRPPERSDCITKSTSVTPLPNPFPLVAVPAGDYGRRCRADPLPATMVRLRPDRSFTREHALVFVYGPGGNGKSVFLNIVAAILQDYAATAAIGHLHGVEVGPASDGASPCSEARILVTASETEEGRAAAEARIKQLTGGDRISARFMRQGLFRVRAAVQADDSRQP